MCALVRGDAEQLRVDEFGAPGSACPASRCAATRPFLRGPVTLTMVAGGVYAWLVRQRVVNRPLLLVGAIGKIGFFIVFALYWAAGVLRG